MKAGDKFWESCIQEEEWYPYLTCPKCGDLRHHEDTRDLCTKCGYHDEKYDYPVTATIKYTGKTKGWFIFKKYEHVLIVKEIQGNYCQYCDQELTGKYCSNCGAKNI